MAGGLGPAGTTTATAPGACRRLTGVGVAAVALLTVGLLVPLRARAAAPPTAEWPDPPAMVAGTATMADRVWTYTDYPYDDTGTGGFAYPEEGAYGDNAADPVVLQIRAAEPGVEHRIGLNTLLEAGTTIVAFAIDTDGNPATGGTDWPRNAKVATPGWDLFVAAWGTGAVAERPDGSSVELPAAADVAANDLTVTIPRAVADPGTGRWRYWGGAGVHDGNGGFAEVVSDSLTAPAPPTSPTGKDDPDAPNLFNLLFRNRAHDEGNAVTDENGAGGFQSARQEAALSGGSIDPFSREVDFATLATGTTHVPEEPPGDAHITRVYASAAHPNGRAEGVTGAGVGGSLYNGRYQPYRLFVPDSYRQDPSPAPMIPQLHGWTGNHRSFNPTDNDWWNEVVRANRALVPKPLGRGEEIWYEHLGELDVLEVMADVALHYNVDPDRIYLAGTSMGGFGTTKIAEAHPDLFAGIVPSVPPMSDRASGYAHPAGNEYDVVELARNLRNTPILNIYGTVDFLVPAGRDPERLCERLRELVYDHDCWRAVTGGHANYDNARVAEFRALVDEHRRVADPAHLTYTLHPYWVDVNDEAGISHLLPYDEVWWASGIEYAPEVLERYADCRLLPGAHTCLGELDVRTWGTGVGDPVPRPFSERPSSTVWRDGIELSPGPAVEPRNHFDLTFANLVGLTLDLERMGLVANPAKPLTAEVTNEGRAVELALTLTGVAGNCGAEVDGEATGDRSSGGRIAVHAPLTGTHTITITCGN